MAKETNIMLKKSLEDTIDEAIEMTKGEINENARINLKKYKSIAWETVDNRCVLSTPFGIPFHLIHTS